MSEERGSQRRTDGSERPNGYHEAGWFHWGRETAALSAEAVWCPGHVWGAGGGGGRVADRYTGDKDHKMKLTMMFLKPDDFHLFCNITRLIFQMTLRIAALSEHET